MTKIMTHCYVVKTILYFVETGDMRNHFNEPANGTQFKHSVDLDQWYPLF